ncbi:MAG: hypothetical protein AAGH42_13525 [Pseudomonadota bacterium]
MPLQRLTEHPDQAMMKLTLKPNTQRLRTHTLFHIEERMMGLGQIVDMMHPIVKCWAHEAYQARVSKTFNAHNLYDFTRPTRISNLVMPARLLVHCYIWISELDYRDAWGPFEPIDNGPVGSPGSGNAAPGVPQGTS